MVLQVLILPRLHQKLQHLILLFHHILYLVHPVSQIDNFILNQKSHLFLLVFGLETQLFELVPLVSEFEESVVHNVLYFAKVLLFNLFCDHHFLFTFFELFQSHCFVFISFLLHLLNLFKFLLRNKIPHRSRNRSSRLPRQKQMVHRSLLIPLQLKDLTHTHNKQRYNKSTPQRSHHYNNSAK